MKKKAKTDPCLEDIFAEQREEEEEEKNAPVPMPHSEDELDKSNGDEECPKGNWY